VSVGVTGDLLEYSRWEDITLVEVSPEMVAHLERVLGLEPVVHHVTEVAEVADKGSGNTPVDEYVILRHR
jgi:hypothetical protein